MSVGKGRRLAALLLCLVMMFSTLGATVPAGAMDPAAGLCEHHPAHTPECGYAPPSEGTPCQHVHDGSCGYIAPVPETPCDMGCTDTDGDGIIDHVDGCAYVPASEGAPCQHVHDASCGYSEATAGSPCQYVCDICNSTPAPEASDAPVDTPPPYVTLDPDTSTETPAPEATEAPAETPVPEATDAPSDTPAPETTTEPTDTPAPTETPEPTEDDIMLLSITGPTVTIKKSGDATGIPTNIDQDTKVAWAHNQIFQLNVNAGFASTTGGQVKITVAPGLKITDYFDDTSSNFDSITSSLTGYEDLPGYAPVTYNTLVYTVRSTAESINLDVTLAVDTVLWPKVNNWSIDDAIKVEFIEDDAATITKTADVTVQYASDEASQSWNRLYVSDSNASVPAAADKDFRMKTFQIAPNLHGTALGFYYTELKVTVPCPKVDGQEVYAEYSNRVDSSHGTPTVATDPGAHTVTFTWNNIYVPAGYSLVFTPYFKWNAQQTEEGTVKFSDVGQLTATATPYSGDPVTFTKDLGDPSFTIKGDHAVTVAGAARMIFNSGVFPVYQLGQFHVRNDGFADTTGELTLTFTYSNTETAHVTAQGIPVGQGGSVTNITYTTTAGLGSEIIQNTNYQRDDNNRCYLLKAPDGQYFTQITATISGFPPQYVGYNNSAPRSPNNGAVTYGTLVNPTGSFTASLDISGDSGIHAANSYTSTITNTGSDTTQMQVTAGSGGPFTFNGSSTNTVQLGTDAKDRTIHYNAVIAATTFPYTSNQVVDKPVIYLRLPNTITVPEGSVKLWSVKTGGSDGNVETPIGTGIYNVTGPEALSEADFHVYKIEFNDNSAAIGCFNQDLGETQLRLTFDMLAAVDIQDMTLKMYETVFVGYNNGRPIVPNGSLDSSQRADRFDVDKDSNITEYFSTMTDAAAYQLDIKAPRIGLEFNSYAKLSGESGYKNYTVPDNNPEGLSAGGHIMYLTKNEETIDFQFTAENKTGSPLSIAGDTLGKEDFYYYIPVPKIDDFWDKAHQHIQDTAFQLNMELTGVDVSETVNDVSGTVNGLVQVLYSTSVRSTASEGDADHYNNSATVEEYYKSWGEIADKSQIKMIRISAAPSAAGNEFPAGYKATFTIHYKFTLNPEELVGYAVEFGPCGVTSYKRNAQSATGHTPTQRVRAELQTGRIAGRVFIDENYNSKFDGGDSMLRYDDTSKVYVETVGSGTYNKTQDGDEPDARFDLTIQASPHPKEGETELEDKERTAQKADFVENTVHNAYDNTYALSSMQARTYTVTVQNPQYADGSVTADSLRFIPLAAEAGGIRSVSGSEHSPKASTYDIIGTGYQGSVTFDAVVNAAGVTDNRMRDIVLQRPHEVTFQVTYKDDYSAAPGQETRTAYVWHGQPAADPDIVLADDFQWAGADASEANWTTTDSAATFGENITSAAREITYTATAVRIPHNVTYDPNGAEGVTMPGTVTGRVNGDTVELTDPTDRVGTVDGKNVVFIGWTTVAQGPVDKGTGKKTADGLNCVTSVPMGTEDITVHALWGYDTNGNEIADVLETRYTLHFDANSGTPGMPTEIENLLDNETVTFESSVTEKPTHGEFDGKPVIFVGWSETDYDTIYGKDNIKDKDTISGYLTDSVTMHADNKTVYAVWSYDENGNLTPDFRETLYTLEYLYSGYTTSLNVNAAKPDGLITPQHYLTGMAATLWKPPVDTPWTGTYRFRGIVFMGWTETVPDKVYDDDSAESAVIAGSEITMNTNRTLYAVWAYDRNNNGTPDYKDKKITILYDVNKGIGGPIPEQNDLVAGAAYLLADGNSLRRDDPVHPGHPAVFVGWSRELLDAVIQEDDAGKVPEIVRNPYTIPADEEGPTITLYAVYGADNNDDGKADYDETAHHVEYFPNGGKRPAGSSGDPYDDSTPFDTCPHHHVAGEKAKLQEVTPMALLIEREGAVLVGWSEEPHAIFGDSPEDRAEAEGIIVEEVLIPEDGEGDRNARVYAVWAEDRNGNHKADYDDPHYSQWYYRNDALVNWAPPSDLAEGYTQNTPVELGHVNSLPAGVDHIVYEHDGLPDPGSNILLDDKVSVPGPVLGTRTDYDAGNNVVHRYIQMGWSGFCHHLVTSDADLEGTSAWVLGNTRTVHGAIYQYNFAAWALDDNHNGVADFDENPYIRHYDLNGGKGAIPGDKKYLPGLTVTLDDTFKPTPTRDNAIFLGWSLEQHDLVKSQTDAEAWKVTFIELPDESAPAGKETITVYALWAINENAADGGGDSVTPDYLETHSLTYDPNPVDEESTVSGMPETLTQTYGYGTKVTVPNVRPTHSWVDGRPMVFSGWSDSPTKPALTREAAVTTIYQPGDTVEIRAYDLTLYAVWAFGSIPYYPPADTPTDTPAPTDTPEPSASPEPSTSPEPTATPEPGATPGPDTTPAPGTTPEPGATPGPDTTPEPGTTPTPVAPTDTPAPGGPAGTTGTPAPAASSRPDEIPWTGDDAHPGLWAALLGLFAAGSVGLAAALTKKRRRAKTAGARSRTGR